MKELLLVLYQNLNRLPNESGDVHTHCVCGGNGNVNGHEHDTAGTGWTEWTPADSLPTSAGNYYLTQSVSGSWTVPKGKVTLCLNGQTISDSITVGNGASLTLTDCSDSGKVQGEVLVNGGKLELYSGTITGGVQVGKKGGTYQSRPKYSSMSLLFIVILPLPGTRYTLATDDFLLPVP